ncbi:MAG TPA: YcbK family protein [Alphaproteobacteria bacterium]|nr:YcbK family protein [Alphaproteobacteria bacterium]
MTKAFETTRRKFIQLGLSTLACTIATPALAALPHMKGVRSMAFHNLHTDERLHVDYYSNGAYNRPALAKINHILRDHYSGDTHPMDIRLIDLVYDLQHKLRNDRPIEIISGYRSPKTNQMLANRSDGVAKNSFHTKGMAMDIRMNGTSLRQLENTALFMHRGGVGYYPDSEFVHVDVGPTRRWGAQVG